MSKFLKFIVNIFLICAILIAAAILIPPLAGVQTTIVDTASMDTNLPLGSITYSTDVDASKIKTGDEVLKDSNTSTYAYIVREIDRDADTFTVVNAMDKNAGTEQITLRNSVPKVAVVVPYIGYVIIAMHSTEGIIIIALVVALIVILFILSELWKDKSEEDDEDEEKEDEEKKKTYTFEENGGAASEISVDDVISGTDSGIDLDVVRDANARAAQAGAEDAEALTEPAAEAQTQQEENYPQSEGEEQETQTEEVDRQTETEETEPTSQTGTEEIEQKTAETEPAADEENISTEVPTETARAKIEIPETLREEENEDEPEKENDGFGISLKHKADEKEENDRNSRLGETQELKLDLNSLLKKKHEAGKKSYDLSEAIEKATEEAEKQADKDMKESPAEHIATNRTETEAPAEHITMEKPAEIPRENIATEKQAEIPAEHITIGNPDGTAETRETAENIADAAENGGVETAEGTDRNQAAEPEDEEPEEFVPVEHATLDELLDQAKKAGDEPDVSKDDATGITVVDYSGVL